MKPSHVNQARAPARVDAPAPKAEKAIVAATKKGSAASVGSVIQGGIVLLTAKSLQLLGRASSPRFSHDRRDQLPGERWPLSKAVGILRFRSFACPVIGGSDMDFLAPCARGRTRS
jgi:hypothetical protein